MSLLDNDLESQLEDVVLKNNISRYMRNYLITKSGYSMFHAYMGFKIIPMFKHDIRKIKNKKHYSFYYDFIYRNEDGMIGEVIGIGLYLFSKDDFGSGLYYPLNITLYELLNGLKHESITLYELLNGLKHESVR